MEEIDCLKNSNSAIFIKTSVAAVQTANAVAVGKCLIAWENITIFPKPNKMYPTKGRITGNPPCHLKKFINLNDLRSENFINFKQNVHAVSHNAANAKYIQANILIIRFARY